MKSVTRTDRGHIDRRTFISASASCTAHMLLMTSGASPSARRFLTSGSQQRIVAQESWGRLEEIGEGLWALISTPLEDRTTLCNGGIIAGADGAVVVEGFASADGAAWMVGMTRELTGSWPSHVVLTHFHGDHTNGIEGLGAGLAPFQLMATDRTRDLVREADAARSAAPSELRSELLSGVTIVDPTTATEIDLGDRVVRIIPHDGHTPSDLAVEIADASVMWCGDLVWNHMFPNYRDAIPSRLSMSVRTLVAARASIYVPGHGALATPEDLDRYVNVIDDVEAAARRAFERGVSAAEAAQEYRLPASLGEWFMFNPRYYEVAIGAWERELREN